MPWRGLRLVSMDPEVLNCWDLKYFKLHYLLHHQRTPAELHQIMATRGAPPTGLPAKPVAVPPNQTLYITNLPSVKIQKEELRTALYLLFSTYGPVIDVVALKTIKMRGQAHIVYRDIQTATQAMRSLDGFELLGREMVRSVVHSRGALQVPGANAYLDHQKISYAKSKSNAIAKLDGTFKLPSTTAAVEVTDLQQSIFNAPAPGTAAAASATSSLPSKPITAVDHVMADANTPESRGTKRTRKEEENDSDSDVAMEEDSDDE